jgi:hypothetical protein
MGIDLLFCGVVKIGYVADPKGICS